MSDQQPVIDVTHPSPVDRLIVAVAEVAQEDLCNDAVTEQDEDEGAHEFREGLPQRVTDLGPHEAGVGRLLGPSQVCRFGAVDESTTLLVGHAGAICWGRRRRPGMVVHMYCRIY